MAQPLEATTPRIPDYSHDVAIAEHLINWDAAIKKAKSVRRNVSRPAFWTTAAAIVVGVPLTLAANHGIQLDLLASAVGASVYGSSFIARKGIRHKGKKQLELAYQEARDAKNPPSRLAALVRRSRGHRDNEVALAIASPVILATSGATNHVIVAESSRHAVTHGAIHLSRHAALHTVRGGFHPVGIIASVLTATLWSEYRQRDRAQKESLAEAQLVLESRRQAITPRS